MKRRTLRAYAPVCPGVQGTAPLKGGGERSTDCGRTGIAARTLVTYASEDGMEPTANAQQDGQEPVAEGDDLLEQASGGKGVVRNGFSLD